MTYLLEKRIKDNTPAYAPDISRRTLVKALAGLGAGLAVFGIDAILPGIAHAQGASTSIDSRTNLPATTPATGDGGVEGAKPYSPEQEIERIIQDYRTKVQGKLNINREYEKVVDLLNPIESLIEYDFTRFDGGKRKIIAEIFNNYAAALEPINTKNGNKDNAKIVALYRKSIQLNPDSPISKANLAAFIYGKKLGNYREALELAEEVLRQDSNNPVARGVKRRLILEKLI